MGKLHEVVAVADDNRGLFDKLLVEIRSTFTDRLAHFTGFRKSYQSIIDDDYERDPEVKVMTETVLGKLNYYEDKLISIFDTQFQREKTNCIAKADIIVIFPDGKEETVAMEVPVTYLIQLEKQLSTLRNKVYNVIPTLDPSKGWEWSLNDGYYIHKEPKKRVTRKEQIVKVKFEPTKEHPGQSELVPIDITTGYYNELDQSGMTTPAKKSELLNRIDLLLHAVKKARTRANEETVVTDKIAQKLFNFINTAEVLKED